MTRLYIWLQRHPTHVDGVVAGFLVLFGLVSMQEGGLQGWWTIPPLLIGTPIVVRRRHPAGVFWTVAAIGLVQVVSPAYLRPSDLAVPIALYGLAVYRPRRASLLGLAVCLVGALVGLGIPEEEARYYEAGLKAGKVLLTVSAGQRTTEAQAILTQHGGRTGAAV